MWGLLNEPKASVAITRVEKLQAITYFILFARKLCTMHRLVIFLYFRYNLIHCQIRMFEPLFWLCFRTADKNCPLFKKCSLCRIIFLRMVTKSIWLHTLGIFILNYCDIVSEGCPSSHSQLMLMCHVKYCFLNRNSTAIAISI